ncbi:MULTISPECIES: thioredoxin [Anaerotruncus]|jgi:thioredoxin 1|uniref:thioredoxin n=1 Tax=Anaerotruncus TaxID=244127 RepID=UPI00083767F8|nr:MULTISPECIES: thioredoxin [Anaerotruncus]RGX54272.1 thioredoxin [Anaerotruncus sp. AF02-27]
MAVEHFTNDTFNDKVLQANATVLVDFWAPWCGPCKMLGPIIEELANDLDGKAVIGKVNIDEEQELAVKYGVMSIPTVVIFKDGQEVSRNVGLTSKHQLTQMIENA